MRRVVVLGGGQQGKVIATDLARDFEVTVADVRPLAFAQPNVHAVQADLADAPTLVRLAASHDLTVGALPARLGFRAAQAAIEAKRPYVDVAFFAEDAAALHADAQRAGIALLPDCGLAPGLTNLIVGRALAERPRDTIRVCVGGVAQDQSLPYGYVVTWSLEDLCDEFKRPARIIRGGRVVSLPATSELEPVHVEGAGAMEAFLTDGLRTLLDCQGVREMTEKTLRWPGHVAAVKPLVDSGRFVEEIGTRCRQGADLVAFRIDVDGVTVTMVDRAAGGLTAMARTTALTAAAFARLVASGLVRDSGVVAPESIGRDKVAYRFILGAVAASGIHFSPALPFCD